MKMFNKIIMASESEPNLLKDCYFQESGVDHEVEDGAVVSIKGLRDHDLYANMKDLNARNCTAYDATAPIVGIVDYVGVSHADVMGVNYRVGSKIAGTYPAAGENTRVRIPALADEFYLCDENFDTVPTAGQFAVPEDGKTTWKVVGTAAASGLCIAIEDDTRDLIMGQVNEGSKMYHCQVISC